MATTMELEAEIKKEPDEDNSANAMDKQTLAAVLLFLKKNNLRATEELLKREAKVDGESANHSSTRSEQEVSSVLSAYQSEGDPSLYEANYRSLKHIIETALDSRKVEQTQLLYPVYVHMYLELVYNGHEHAAIKLFQAFQNEQEDYHQDDLVQLATVTKKEHMRHSELIMNLRSSKYVLRLSRDSYQSLKRQLQEKSNNVILNILQEHLYIDVFDGMPRSKEQIDAASGGMCGEAKRKANKSKMSFGLLKEPDINLLLDDEEEGVDGEDKPKKKKAKRLDVKKSKPDPNAPAQNRIPLPEMRDVDKLEKLLSFRELSKRVHLSPDLLPSVCFYTLLNATQGLISVEISDDSSLLAAGFADSNIRLWTLTPKKLRSIKPAEILQELEKEAEDVMERIMDERSSTDCKVLVGHSGPVYATSFSPDRNLLLSASGDGTVRLWNLFTFSTLVCYKGHNFPVWDVAFGPFGHYFVSCGKDRTARLWTTESHQPIRLFAGHYSDTNCVCFHPNSNYVATGSCDRMIKVWDILNGKCVRVMTGHKGPIHKVLFSPNGHFLASVSEDCSVMLWGLRHSNLIAELKGHTESIYSLSFCRDGNVLASGGLDNVVKLWDVKKIFAEAESEDFNTAHQVQQNDSMQLLLGSYPTKNTTIHHLHFTRRNLLLAVGAFSVTS
ncbi:transcription initiation factor TFIID subunit 5-like [Apostichopus japonicus]|uniref:transcription initiation factor TFIID subunit 5-like n=1 Tax=Stichopus japonicus TaxID=307972 RepID=UPI003AB5FB64